MLDLKSIIQNDHTVTADQKIDQIISMLEQNWSIQQLTLERVTGQINNHGQLIQSLLSESQSNYNAYFSYVQEFARRLKERDEVIEELKQVIKELRSISPDTKV